MRDHGHDAVGPNANENMGLVANLSAHDLHLSSRGSSVPRAGSSSPSRPRRPRAALRVPAPGISHSAASRWLRAAAGVVASAVQGRSVVVGSHAYLSALLWDARRAGLSIAPPLHRSATYAYDERGWAPALSGYGGASASHDAQWIDRASRKVRKGRFE